MFTKVPNHLPFVRHATILANIMSPLIDNNIHTTYNASPRPTAVGMRRFMPYEIFVNFKFLEILPYIFINQKLFVLFLRLMS